MLIECSGEHGLIGDKQDSFKIVTIKYTERDYGGNDISKKYAYVF